MKTPRYPKGTVVGIVFPLKGKERKGNKHKYAVLHKDKSYWSYFHTPDTGAKIRTWCNCTKWLILNILSKDRHIK